MTVVVPELFQLGFKSKGAELGLETIFLQRIKNRPKRKFSIRAFGTANSCNL
jgi:hypothetical protein